MPEAVPEGTVEGLVDHLKRFVGDALRGVTWYHEGERGLIYIREDVRGKYTDQEVERAIEDMELEALADPERLETTFDMGRHHCTVHWFDDGILVHVPCADFSGAAYTVDHSAASEVGGLVGLTMAYLDAFVRPTET